MLVMVMDFYVVPHQPLHSSNIISLDVTVNVNDKKQKTVRGY